MSNWRPRRGRASQNGSFRGSRGTRGRGRWPYAPISLPSDRDIFEGLSDAPLCTLEKPGHGEAGKEIKIEDLEYIGSYNWITAPDGQPTIIVPGMSYM